MLCPKLVLGWYQNPLVPVRFMYGRSKETLLYMYIMYNLSDHLNYI